MSEETHVAAQYMLIFVLVICYTLASELIQKNGIRFIHESGVTIMLGFLSSMLFPSLSIQFEQESFFMFLLPPIIFAGGFNLKRRRFFKNFYYIGLFGVAATIVNFFITSGIIYYFSENDYMQTLDGEKFRLTIREILLYSALLCSSDAVAALTIVKYDEHPNLFSVLFGESTVNDAVSIVMFTTVLNYTGGDSTFDWVSPFWIALDFIEMGVVSLLIGLIFAGMCSVLLKSELFEDAPVAETTILFFFGYMAYVMAEMLHFSGIIALLFTGIGMAHYAFYNLSDEAKKGSTLSFSFLGHTCEGLIFSLLGLSIPSYENENWSTSLVLVSLLALMASRVIGIFFMAMIGKCSRGSNFLLSVRELWVIWFAGAIRGAIAFGLALRLSTSLPNYFALLTSALSLVVGTTVIFGAAFPGWIKLMGITSQNSEASMSEDEIRRHFLHPNMQAVSMFETRVRKRGGLKRWWYRMDDEYLKPCLIRRAHIKKHNTEDENTLFGGKTHGVDDDYLNTSSLTKPNMEFISNLVKSSRMVKLTRKDTRYTPKKFDAGDEE